MSDIIKIKDEYLLKLNQNLDLNQINQIKTDLFGKNGLVSSQFKQLGKIAEDERKKFASDLNTTKDELQDLISSKIDEIETKEINLSKKEVELLTIFVANPNKIIKREELSKQVWEDQGVFVGRSLDTYISKLRKKLSDDETIKLTNIHGIGYNLEIKENGYL